MDILAVVSVQCPSCRWRSPICKVLVVLRTLALCLSGLYTVYAAIDSYLDVIDSSFSLDGPKGRCIPFFGEATDFARRHPNTTVAFSVRAGLFRVGFCTNLSIAELDAVFLPQRRLDILLEATDEQCGLELDRRCARDRNSMHCRNVLNTTPQPYGAAWKYHLTENTKSDVAGSCSFAYKLSQLPPCNEPTVVFYQRHKTRISALFFSSFVGYFILWSVELFDVFCFSFPYSWSYGDRSKLVVPLIGTMGAFLIVWRLIRCQAYVEETLNPTRVQFLRYWLISLLGILVSLVGLWGCPFSYDIKLLILLIVSCTRCVYDISDFVYMRYKAEQQAAAVTRRLPAIESAAEHSDDGDSDANRKNDDEKKAANNKLEEEQDADDEEEEESIVPVPVDESCYDACRLILASHDFNVQGITWARALPLLQQSVCRKWLMRSVNYATSRFGWFMIQQYLTCANGGVLLPTRERILREIYRLTVIVNNPNTEPRILAECITWLGVNEMMRRALPPRDVGDEDVALDESLRELKVLPSCASSPSSSSLSSSPQLAKQHTITTPTATTCSAGSRSARAADDTSSVESLSLVKHVEAAAVTERRDNSTAQQSAALSSSSSSSSQAGQPVKSRANTASIHNGIAPQPLNEAPKINQKYVFSAESWKAAVDDL